MFKRTSQAGFAVIETVLVVVIIAVIGFTSWFVVHAKHNADTSLKNASSQTIARPNTKKTTTSSTPSTGTDNASLNSDLNGIDSSQSQAASDSAATDKGLNDSSSEISVPTN